MSAALAPTKDPLMTKRAAILTALFIALIWAANYATNRWGFVTLGPWAFTAGTYAAGLSFGVRDALHEVAGRRLVVVAIAIGAAFSAFLSPALALASGAAFLFGESADLAIYLPLRRRHWAGAVVASNLAGAVVDTVLFLWIASYANIPGLNLNWDTFTGQMVGKALMILPALVLVGWLRRRR